MIYADYVFEILKDGTLILDKEIKEITGAKDGDQYILRYSELVKAWAFVRKTQ
jgi:hypothetical protein